MKAIHWWRSLSLFLWIYCTSAAGFLLVYVYGIGRLAERKFGGRAFLFLLPAAFALLATSNGLFALSSQTLADELPFSILPALAGAFLLAVTWRLRNIMLK
ncbi:MAG: hypothetical protein WHT46_01620 [Candidatus Geothermincolales bacterium]